MARYTETISNNLEAVKEYLQNLDDSELVNAHNTYSLENNSDNEIYGNDEDFFNTFFEGKVWEAVRATTYGDFTVNHNWIKFNGYANLETTNNPSEWVDITEIASDILENPERYDIELEDDESEDEETV